MTRRTRQAIIRYWLSKQTLHWRRPLRFFVLFLSCSLFFSGVSFAAESKTNEPVGLLKMLDSKTSTLLRDKSAKEAAKKKKFELPALSQEDEKAEGVVKHQKGTVSARNKYGMAVEYEIDEVNGSSKEIWVNFHKKMKLTGVKDISAIGEGDTVDVEYKLTKEKKKIVLQGIAFISKKPKEVPQEAKAVKS